MRSHESRFDRRYNTIETGFTKPKVHNGGGKWECPNCSQKYNGTSIAIHKRACTEPVSLRGAK